jgi:hypothetical protein
MLKANNGSQPDAKRNSQNALPADPSFCRLTLDEQPGIAPALPFASHYRSGSTAVAGGQIAGANSAGEIGRFGQVAAFFAIGPKHAVATRRGCTPGAVAALPGDQGQGIFGIDSNDFTPGHFDIGENVDQRNVALGDYDFGVIEHHPGCSQNRYQCGERGERHHGATARENYGAGRQQQPANNEGQNSTKSRVENYGLHATKFASDFECEVAA